MEENKNIKTLEELKENYEFISKIKTILHIIKNKEEEGTDPIQLMKELLIYKEKSIELLNSMEGIDLSLTQQNELYEKYQNEISQKTEFIKKYKNFENLKN
jgi:hypothetical protein